MQDTRGRQLSLCYSLVTENRLAQRQDQGLCQQQLGSFYEPHLYSFRSKVFVAVSIFLFLFRGWP